MEFYSNELIHETSLYLKQHAHNPVNWIPWSESVFEQAKQQQKLVIVSIGYSSCHWCHVMEKEAFEDLEVAAIMNKHFICVKVDREERPDIDNIYMTAVQLMTQRGGWPLNCITLPDGRPIYGGTYFPKDQWMHVLISLVYTVQHESQKVLDYATQLHQGIQQSESLIAPEKLSTFHPDKLHNLVNRWHQRMDFENGGTGVAPKFPLPNNLEFLFWYTHCFENNNIEQFVNLSLKKMAFGGIYDQLGGGFSRYSVDAEWKIPHFEKMLYDNAQLLQVFALGFASSQIPEYQRIINQTLEWLQREMCDENGALFASQDADSEGEEGKYYCWTLAEIEKLLGNEAAVFMSLFNPSNIALWEDDKLVLQRNETWEDWQQKQPNRFIESIESQRKLLLKYRMSRILPLTDNKKVSAWNALAVSGLIQAHLATKNPKFIHQAKQTLNWLINQQWKGGKLYRIYESNKRIEGFLDDYATGIQALLCAYQVLGDAVLLERANQLTSLVLNQFSSAESPLFFYTSSQELIARSVEINDSVIPASNSIMAHNLLSLSLLTGNVEYEHRAAQLLSAVYDGMEHMGSGYSNWALLLLRFTQGVTVVTRPKEWELQPNVLSPFVLHQFHAENHATVCVGKSCSLPLYSPDELQLYLKQQQIDF